MLLTLEALNAEEGDCLLLHVGTKQEPLHILIDGGPGGTYLRSLQPRLRELRELHGLDDAERLPIELAVLTHTDADHIDGLVAMFEDLRKTKEHKQALPYRIKRLWYNSFDDIVRNHEVGSIQSLSASASPEVRAFVAGTKMGQALRDLARKLEIPVNRDFEDYMPEGAERCFAMRTAAEAPCIEVEDLNLTVLSPTAKELEDFEEEWNKYLREQAKKQREGGATAYGIDQSRTNLSSIVVLAEAGRHSLLLAGDARASQILDGLRASGRLADDGEPCDVDLFKIGHHGARGNQSLALFQQVRAKHYVISANGKHGNPDRESLDMLWEARGKGDWQIWTTFPRDAFKLIDPGAARTESEQTSLEKRRAALEEVQAWFDAHPVKVTYREPHALGIQIHLGDEKLD
jgi:hypothetical protein